MREVGGCPLEGLVLDLQSAFPLTELGGFTLLVAGQPGLRRWWRRLIIPAAAVDAMADAAAFTAEGCVAGSVGELNDGVYRAGLEGAGQRSSLWGRVCSVLGFRPGGGCVSC
jgi:hypothetical protein